MWHIESIQNHEYDLYSKTLAIMVKLWLSLMLFSSSEIREEFTLKGVWTSIPKHSTYKSTNAGRVR